MTHPEHDEERESLVRWITDKAQAFAEDKPVATFPVDEVRKRIAAHTAKAVEEAERAARIDEQKKGSPMSEQSKVREILEFVWSLSPHNKNRMAEAEQALYDAMREVIKPKNAIDRFTKLNTIFGKKGE